MLDKWVLVLVGFLQPLDALLDQTFTRTREITMEWAKLHPSLINQHFHQNRPWVIYIREYTYACQLAAGLGWVAATPGCVIGS